ncbi:MAG TPA: hypothetical protein PLZ43_13420 [bacterium]|nr:hypothetical protein [bacterium]
MASCPGRIEERNIKCPGSLYVCPNCQNVGCNQNGCTNQAFDSNNGKCLRCGKYGKKPH